MAGMTDPVSHTFTNHPLFGEKLEVLSEWSAAKGALWDDKDVDSKLRFLYRCFEFKGPLLEKITFCLSVAYGHHIRNFFGWAEFQFGENSGPLQFWDSNNLKEHIAQKAWATMCENFFKDKNRRHGPKSWEQLLTPEILQLIFFFFEEPRNYPSSEDSTNHYDESARDFLHSILCYGWESQQWTTGCITNEVRDYIQRDEKRLIRLAYRLHESELLLNHWGYLSEESVAYLEEIALKPSIIYPWITVESERLEEALFREKPVKTFAQTALVIRELYRERDRKRS